MNRQEFEDVKMDLKKDPTKFDMFSWCNRDAGPCGTTFCVAGNILHRKGFFFSKTGDAQILTPWGTRLNNNLGQAALLWGAIYLDIPIVEARRIFFPDNWDPDLQEQLDVVHDKLVFALDAYAEARTKKEEKEIFEKIKKLRERGVRLAVRQISRIQKETKDMTFEAVSKVEDDIDL